MHSTEGRDWRRRRAAAVAAAVAMGMLGAACGSSGGTGSEQGRDGAPTNAGVIEDDGPATAGGSIIYGLEAETDGWNPSNSKWGPAGVEVSRAVFDTLTAYDDAGNAVPNLAESLTPSADYRQWTITLRPGVTLHNGRPVTADVVKEGFEYLKASPLTTSAFDPIESFGTQGELEVVVNMVRPWVNYPHSLATQIGVVVDPDWLRSGAKDAPIGTGAFVYEEWIPDSRFVAVRNPDYWRQDPSGVGYPHLDEVEFRPIADDDARAASLRAGNIDIMQTSAASQLETFTELSAAGEYQMFADRSGETSEVFVQLNTMAAPFDDPDARRALVLATDPEQYVQVQGQGLYEVARGPFAPSSPWYTPTDYPDFDLDAAKVLVDEVKARNDGAFSFQVLGGADANALAGLQLLQQQWKEAGIDASIDPVEQAQLITKVATGDYQATSWRQFEAPHPLGDSIWWHPNTAKPLGEIALNFARNKNEAIGRALDGARETTDPAREKELYGDVQRLLAEDLPYVWLYHEQISVVAANSLVNVVNYTLPGGERGIPLQSGSHPLWQVWLRD